MPGTGIPILPEHPLNYGVTRTLFRAKNVNMNIAGDQPMKRIGDFKSCTLTGFWLVSPSLDMSPAFASVWTGPNATGIEIAPNASLAGLTVAAGRMISGVYTQPINFASSTPDAYFRVNTLRGAAATVADIFILGLALD